MKTLVLYYSLTGATAKVAQFLTEALEADVVEIQCLKYRTGWFRYLRVGRDSVKGNLPDITLPKMSFSDYDLIILGSPVWTSYPSLPLRSFLSQKHSLPRRVALFFTYGGNSIPEKATDSISELLPVEIEAVMGVRNADVKASNFIDSTNTFISKLS